MSFLSSIWSGISSAVKSVGNWIGNTAGDILEPITHSKENLQMQKDNLEYQKQLQERIFEREDTAVQRRTDDLIAAGLSPTLASGSGAGAGAVVNTSAPARNSDLGNISTILGLLSMKKDLQAKSLANEIAGIRVDQAKENLDFSKEFNPLQIDKINKMNDILDIDKVLKTIQSSKLSKDVQTYYIDKYFEYLGVFARAYGNMKTK